LPSCTSSPSNCRATLPACAIFHSRSRVTNSRPRRSALTEPQSYEITLNCLLEVDGHRRCRWLRRK
jgi:hypothetical protein